MKTVAAFLILFILCPFLRAQEPFTITRYDIHIKVNRDASLQVTENLDAYFSQPAQGIVRSIPYQYPMEKLPAGIEQTQRQMHASGYTRILIENVRVPGRHFSIGKSGDYENINIFNPRQLVKGRQLYTIQYTILDAVNFFSNHSELYFNLIGEQWNTNIDSVNFAVVLPRALPDTPYYFVASGILGSKVNNTYSRWQKNQILSGHTLAALHPHEGLMVGISFPEGFLMKPDYTLHDIWWLLLPVLVFTGMFFFWKRWNKDEVVAVETQYYPPEGISPCICGYLIDHRLDVRDLIALVPYWGAGGYLSLTEIEKSSLLGMVKNRDYIFTRIKDLPVSAPDFERTLFNGIFASGKEVKLSGLTGVLYEAMNKAKTELKSEIDTDGYYVNYPRGMGCIFPFLGILVAAIGSFALIDDWHEKLWLGSALVASGVVLVAFGLYMTKKTRKGTLLYRQLLGFREFLRTAEKDRLQELLKMDENYFDKILPFAIVFGNTGKWKDKLKGLEIPVPGWYHGSYGARNFNLFLYMEGLDHSMNQMMHHFHSARSAGGRSG